MTVRNALDHAFRQAREEGRGVLMPYLTAGYPDREGFVDLALTVLENGDMLEIGIPFSDPLLDGPSVQVSQQRALDAGVTPTTCLEYAREINSRSQKPLLFMGAYNPIYAYGVDRFCADAAGAGVSGLIVPDVPFEEQGELRDGANGHGLHLIQLVAPTSTEERLGRVCAYASGFIYCISLVGVTGARSSVAATARPLVERVRACSQVPVAVGFGISGPDAAREVIEYADGVIVASRLLDLLRESAPAERLEVAGGFIKSLREAVDRRVRQP
jgi:tryptophan synthase alpha chain